MANREEIKREYGALKDRILNEVFELAASAQHPIQSKGCGHRSKR